jgi:hypothetical protein
MRVWDVDPIRLRNDAGIGRGRNDQLRPHDMQLPKCR